MPNDELEEILSCGSDPLLKAYIHGLFRAACCLWKFVVPVDARAAFQNENMKQYARKYAEHGRKYAAICRKIYRKYAEYGGNIEQYAEYAEVISWHILHIAICMISRIYTVNYYFAYYSAYQAYLIAYFCIFLCIFCIFCILQYAEYAE